MFGGYGKSKIFIRLSHSLYLRDEKKIRLFPAPAMGGGMMLVAFLSLFLVYVSVFMSLYV